MFRLAHSVLHKNIKGVTHSDAMLLLNKLNVNTHTLSSVR